MAVIKWKAGQIFDPELVSFALDKDDDGYTVITDFWNNQALDESSKNASCYMGHYQNIKMAKVAILQLFQCFAQSRPVSSYVAIVTADGESVEDECFYLEDFCDEIGMDIRSLVHNGDFESSPERQAKEVASSASNVIPFPASPTRH